MRIFLKLNVLRCSSWLPSKQRKCQQVSEPAYLLDCSKTRQVLKSFAFEDVIMIKKLDTDHFGALSPFFHGLTHEIRNPVQGILTSAEALRALFEEEVGAAKLLDLIQRECIRLNQLLSDVISLSEPVKPNTTAQSLQMMISETARLYPNVVVELDPALPDIVFDRTAMGLALRAIVENAAEAQLPEKRIFVSAKADVRLIEITVADEGLGILEEDLSHVFDPFFTTRKRHAGLGLTIAQRIVKQHGGDLQIQSQPGKGTVAKVLIPITS